MRRFATRALFHVVCENLLFTLAVLTSVWLRLGGEAWETFSGASGLLKTWFIATVVQFCLYCTDLYDARAYADVWRLFMSLVRGLGAATLFLAVIYFWIPALWIGRGVFGIATILIVLVVAVWRLAERWLSVRVPRERLLLVGTGPQSVALARELFERRLEFGVEIVGFIDPDPSRVGAPVINPGVIGVIADIPAIAAARQVSRVVVGVEDARGKLPMDKLLRMKLSGVRFDHLVSVYEEYTGKIALENLRPSWFIFGTGFHRRDGVFAAKRLFDVIAALVGLTIGLPLMIVVAIAIKLTSHGPVFYHQRRVGQHGHPFIVHKFRSMRTDAEASSGAVWASKADPRVTSIGRLLRRTRCDELPQLWNVLVGEMSLVGPRPERPEFVHDLTRQIPFYGERHVIKPGITGWAQVQYAYGASVEDTLQKLQYDLFYIKNFTLALDVLIVVSTIKTVLLGRGAV